MVFILSLRICTHVVNESRRTPSAAYREYNQMDQCLCFCLVPYAKEEHQRSVASIYGWWPLQHSCHRTAHIHPCPGLPCAEGLKKKYATGLHLRALYWRPTSISRIAMSRRTEKGVCRRTSISSGRKTRQPHHDSRIMGGASS